MSAAEPTRTALRNPWWRYFLATRPAFLLASLLSCLIGLATAGYSGVPLRLDLALATVLGAVLVNAGVNVLNDYYDALNGSDQLNTDRLYPFTGGSRFIQNGVLTAGQTARYGILLLVAGGVVGVLLAVTAGPLLWLIGATGLVLGWAYSAPPLALNSRGLGELSVAIGFGVLIPLGADYVQRGALTGLPIAAGMPYALLVANLLYINQFPDRRADAAAGKRHWVVRLGAQCARWVYAVAALAAYVLVVVEIAAGVLPAIAAISLLPAVVSVMAAQRLIRHADRPQALVPAIRLTILAALSHGLLMAAALSGAHRVTGGG